MATGRTLQRWARFYMDGYDFSSYIRKIGELKQEFEANLDAALADEVKGALPGTVQLSIGTTNGFFDNTAVSGLHVVASGGGVKRVVMVPIGIRALPAQGDPVFAGEFEQLNYQAVEENGYVVASIPFGNVDVQAAALAYQKAWGTLLHAKAARTAVNTATGVDGGAASSRGGFMVYQVFAAAGSGNVTIKGQDAEANEDASFADITGLTSGAIADTSVPCAGVVALATTATIRQFTRWQIVLSGISSVTFALALVRG